ncbi:MAG: hypothetical protein MUF54_03895 [Polyangiaceae bacterium]|nr:hypothetical protein [Polyangiaceae bacterium]
MAANSTAEVDARGVTAAVDEGRGPYTTVKKARASVFAICHMQGRPCLAIEFLPGRSLPAHVARAGGKLPVTHWHGLFLDAARGLATAQNGGLSERRPWVLLRWLGFCFWSKRPIGFLLGEARILCEKFGALEPARDALVTRWSRISGCFADLATTLDRRRGAGQTARQRTA